MKTLCIDGWRGVNHSIAMVNQYQLLAMLDEPGWRLWHRDLPFFLKHWNARQMPAGFTAAEQARIDAVPAPADGQRFDALLRISSPFRSQIDPAQRTFTFMVTECGLLPECFDVNPVDMVAFTRGDNRVITPSTWARDRLVEGGVDGQRIHVLPHGVKAETFAPLSPAGRREARLALGVQDDEVLFVNVGVATWNKGLDLLVKAFAKVRQRHKHVKLLLKDHKALYGMGADRTMAQVARAEPGLINDDVLAATSLISGSLDQQQLRALYAMADSYVSPYRAEGFNMPVLEAMACGATVIVTDGGATDDFCPPALTTKLPAREGTTADEATATGRFLVPDLDALVEAMMAVAEHRVPADAAAQLAARQALVARHDWPQISRELLALMAPGGQGAGAPASSAANPASAPLVAA